MRKSLVAVVAALTALVFATTVAVAQTPGADITFTVSPTKVGTAKKPKPAKVSLAVKNEDSSQTANRLQIFHAKQIKVSGKGLKKCSQATLERELDPSACPSASKVGSGTANAIAGVNTQSPAPLAFSVTALLLSNTKVGFLIKQQGGDIATLAIGTFKKASGKYGTVLDVAIPQIAREYPTGNFNGLVDLKTTLNKKSGKNSLYKTVGCPSNKKLPVRTVITFQDNPGPPKAATVTADGTASCSK